MLFSIVIPIYNLEDILDKTLKSIEKQTSSNYEVLLIDDGSSDKSKDICFKYTSKYTNWRYLYKTNGGLSDARNYGITKSEGKYIIFVDGDDILDSNTISYFCEIIKSYSDLDLMTGLATRVEGQKYTKYKLGVEPNRIYSGKEYFVKELENRSLNMAAWLRIYRKEFLIKNNLFFKKNLLHEDEEFTPRVLLKANRVYVTNYYFYEYIIREGSITQNKDLSKNGLDIIKIMMYLDEYLKENEDSSICSIFDNYLVSQLLAGYTMINDENFRIEKNKFKNRNLLLKTRIKVCIYRISPLLYKRLHRKILERKNK